MSAGFKCKQFFVGHDQCAMKVGTDGLLLGAWASLTTTHNATTYLDIGTGSGLVSLMLAQRNPDARIDAVELDSAAADQASHNFQQSPFRERLKLLKGDILTYQPAERYALIVSNPPFFANALQGQDPLRNQARHTDLLPLPCLLKKAAELLAPGGSFAVILPEASATNLAALATAQGWFALASCQVRSRADKAPIRRLMQWQREPCVTLNQQLVIHDVVGAYSKQYQQLLKDFYLKF